MIFSSKLLLIKFYSFGSFHERTFFKTKLQAPVTHTCNPSYSRGRNQEDSGLKPAQANSSTRPYFEKTLHKHTAVEWFKV
jgi:hypothetical protein